MSNKIFDIAILTLNKKNSIKGQMNKQGLTIDPNIKHLIKHGDII